MPKYYKKVVSGIKDANGYSIKYHDVVANEANEILLVDIGGECCCNAKDLTVVNKLINVDERLDIYKDGELEIIGNIDYNDE